MSPGKVYSRHWCGIWALPRLVSHTLTSSKGLLMYRLSSLVGLVQLHISFLFVKRSQVIIIFVKTYISKYFGNETERSMRALGSCMLSAVRAPLRTQGFLNTIDPAVPQRAPGSCMSSAGHH